MATDPRRFDQIEKVVRDDRRRLDDVESTVLARLSAHTHAPALVPFAPVTLTDAATIATNAALGSHFRVTLRGNRTLGNPTNLTDGQQIFYEFIQDATGSRTLTLGGNFALGTTITSTTLTTTANKRDFMRVVYNSTAGKLYVIEFIKGY